MTCRGTSAWPDNVVLFTSVWQPTPARARKVKILMRATGLLRLRSLRKNVRGGRGALIFVEQLHPFIDIKYPRDAPLASELTRSFLFWWVGTSSADSGP